MTLRRKIVALTLGLLLLFAMTAAASLLLQNRISEHFSAVVDDYLPLDAVVGTVDVFTDRYELDLRRPAADLREPGANAEAIAQQGEAARRREAEVLTTTFQKTQAQLDQIVQDPRASVERRLAMADIRGRFEYMKRALPNFIEVGRRMSEALGAGHTEGAEHVAADFASYRDLFGQDLTAVRDQLAALTAGAAGDAYRLNRELIILEVLMLGLASLIGLGLSLIVSNRMMAGLQRLIEGTRRIQDGQAYEVLPVTSNDEIGKLTMAFNQMIEDLRTKDHIKETFGKFVDPRIVANLIDPAGSRRPSPSPRRSSAIACSRRRRDRHTRAARCDLSSSQDRGRSAAPSKGTDVRVGTRARLHAIDARSQGQRPATPARRSRLAG
jgi:adenylate cyclase